MYDIIDIIVEWCSLEQIEPSLLRIEKYDAFCYTQHCNVPRSLSLNRDSVQLGKANNIIA